MLIIAKYPSGKIAYLHRWDSIHTAWKAILVFEYHHEEDLIEVFKNESNSPDDYVDSHDVVRGKTEIAKFLLKNL